MTELKVYISNPLPIIESTFYNAGKATLYVPAGSKAAYEAADYWKEFKEIVEMEPEVPTIANTAGNLQNVVSTDVTSLKITGDLNGTDINYLRTLINDHSLTSLDLADARIVEGGEAYVVDGTSYNTENDNFGNYIFADCANLESIVLPSSITSIGYYTLRGTGITSITIPSSVHTIGLPAFSYCIGLTSIKVAQDNTHYDSRNNCNAIIQTSTDNLISGCKNTLIPTSVTSIGTYAFNGCSSLTSITIPEGVTSIGERAFLNCSSLTSVTIPESVTSIGYGAFHGCTGLTEPVYTSKLFAYLPVSYQGEYVIPSNIETICGGAFHFCSGLTSVSIPESVTSIGAYAFDGCSMASITIPSSVTSIGDGAFEGCSSLTSVTVENPMPVSISSNSFTNRTNATLYVPAGSKAAYEAADYWKEFKEIVEMEPEVPTIANTAGSLQNVVSTDVTSLKITGDLNGTDINYLRTLINDHSLTSLDLVDARIVEGGEAYVVADTSYNTENDKLGDNMFADCANLESIVLPSSITSIGSFTFKGTGITSITIPESVTSIGGYSFDGCTILKSVTMPANAINFTGRYAFGENNNIESVYISDMSAWLGITFTYGNNPLRSGAKLYLNNEEVKDLVIPDGTTILKTAAFEGCESLTSVTIPSSVTEIGTFAFDACRALTSTILNEGLTTIGDNAFANCTSLTEITIPSSVTEIGIFAFSGCRGLTSITLNEGLTQIRDDAFAYCTSLTEITIPSTVENIHGHAFMACRGLTSVTILGKPNQHFRNIAFQDCPNLTTFRCNGITLEPVDGVYQIGTAEALHDFAILSTAANCQLDACLTADIDYTAYTYGGNWYNIGMNGYAGTFDGQGHTITVNVVVVNPDNTWDEQSGALFNRIDEGGVVENLRVAGRIENYKFSAGIAHQIGNATISHCVTDVDLVSYATGDCTHGGIVSRTWNNGVANESNIEYCVVAGSFQGATANCRGGLVGWIENEDRVNFSHCLFVANVDELDMTGSDTWARNMNGHATISDCYYLNTLGTTSTGTQTSSEQLASGELCYLLNGESSENPTWTQTLGQDEYPVPFRTHRIVYAEGNGYVNEYIDIATAQDLIDFATRVNSGETDLFGRLTSDIDLAGMEFTPIGSLDNMYTGTFDGQGHKISNLVIDNDQARQGLFNTAGGGAVIRNLTLDATCSIKCSTVAAGIVASTHGPGTLTIENCGNEATITAYKNCGGIIGGNFNDSGYGRASMVNIINCYNSGRINGTIESAGIAGWLANNCNLQNCYNIGEVTGLDGTKTFARVGGSNITINNCYETIGSQVTTVTASQVTSGELCYLLNGDQKTINWYQTLGEDATPVPWDTHKQVYPDGPVNCDGSPIGVAYSNTPISSLPPHDFQHGLCTQCGLLDNEYLTPVDGYYELADGLDLAWFSAMVNSSSANKSLNGKLTADIDLTDVEFTPIGTFHNMYTGTFDGQGHMISNLVIDNDQEKQGLFGAAGGGAVIRNLTLDATCSIKCASYAAGIVGATHSPGTLTIENCGNEATITAYRNCGGILGVNHAQPYGYASMVNIINCYNSGNINGTIESAGMAGWLANNCNLQNCYNIGEVTGIDGTSTFARMEDGNITINNCYETIGSQVTTVTASQVTSGELCYLLNGESSETPTWTQTLGVANSHPVPNASQKVVYKDGDTYYNEIETELLMADSKARPGNTAQIVISMNNLVPITAAQFEMVVPEGTSVRDMTLTNRKDASHSIAFQQLPNGNWQGTVLSMQSVAFSGNSGAIINVSLHVDEGMSEGEYTVRLKNIELTTTDEVAINPLDCSSTLTLSNEISIGDANGDGKISVTDAVSIVNYILGNASASFHPEAADVNEDGKISITDAVAVINRILNQGVSNVKGKRFPVSTLEAQ